MLQRKGPRCASLISPLVGPIRYRLPWRQGSPSVLKRLMYTISGSITASRRSCGSRSCGCMSPSVACAIPSARRLCTLSRARAEDVLTPSPRHGRLPLCKHAVNGHTSLPRETLRAPTETIGERRLGFDISRQRRRCLMVTPCNGPPTSSTPQDVDAWLLDAQERLAQLQCQVARPGQTC